jgi:putative transposase
MFSTVILGMDGLPLTPGSLCYYQGRSVTVIRALDLTQIQIEISPGHLTTVAPTQLQHAPNPKCIKAATDSFQFADEDARLAATDRFEIIKPLLGKRIARAVLLEVAKRHGVGEATLRRWMYSYNEKGIAGLLKLKPDGGKKRSRLDERIEQVLQDSIKSTYLTLQGHSVDYVFKQVQHTCAQQKLRPPSLNTLRRRIQMLTKEQKIRSRSGLQTAKEQFTPLKTNTLQVHAPLDVVEMDHALLNIMLVDEKSGRPLGRPWLTLAMDLYSRMVVGFNLSLEIPGAGGTGLCLSHAILPKETWLAQRNIEGIWPCWGKMKVLHMDNAKEFTGSMITRACQQYEISIKHRPPGQPRYGGHVERLIRTLKFRIRHLPGAFFGTQRDRRVYRPGKRAIFTLAAFEKWLATYLVRVYHVQVHSALGTGPLDYYQEYMLAGAGTRIPERPVNEQQVKLDFMPFEKRTIQRYGVVIGYLHYYDPVLQPYIEGRRLSLHEAAKSKYVFRVDPRDESKIYFLDPDTSQYHTIPLLDLTQGSFSALSKREAIRRVKMQNPEVKQIRAREIFAALEELRSQQLAAQQQADARIVKSYKPLSLAKHRHRQEAAARIQTTLPPQEESTILSATATIPETTPDSSEKSAVPTPLIQPFPDLDDGTSTLFYC